MDVKRLTTSSRGGYVNPNVHSNQVHYDCPIISSRNWTLTTYIILSLDPLATNKLVAQVGANCVGGLMMDDDGDIDEHLQRIERLNRQKCRSSST